MELKDFREMVESASATDLDAMFKAVSEVRKARKDEVAESRKSVSAEAKAEAEKAGREAVEKLEEGDSLVVIFKGVETEVSFVKMTEKRFTVEIDGVKRSVMFDKFVRVADEVEDEAEAIA